MKRDPEESAPIPAHYPTIRGSLRMLGVQYLKSLDATVRILGAWIIWGILFGGIWVVLWALGGFWAYLQQAFGGTGSGDLTGRIFGILSLLFGPPIIRVGLLGAGFEIPTLFRKPG